MANEHQTHQHTFANPGPAALIGLVMACFSLFALTNGKVNGTAAPILACWLVGGGLLQYMTGIMELRNGDMKGGNTFFLFGSFLMFANAISVMTKFILTTKNIPFDPRIEGWAWLGITICVLLWTPAFLRKTTGILFTMMVTLDVALVFLSFLDMGVLDKAVFGTIPGIALLVMAIQAIYLTGAMILNDAFDKTILPIPKPIIK
jgi:succinate-acetate transporter protein